MKELRAALYEIAQINGWSQTEYKNLCIEIDQAIDRFARTTQFDTTGVTPDLDYEA